MNATDRISGRLVQTYSYTVPADPGWAQHGRHKGEGTEPNTRDDAPTGGGWQPPSWGQSGVNVLPGNSNATNPQRSHKDDSGHKGAQGRGSLSQSFIVRLENQDVLRAPGDAPADLLGAGGAANGGLRREGSPAWMNPGASRRRADGGVVFRAPGFLLGHKHTPVTAQHRQGLHMNKPTIRGVRQKIITVAALPWDNNGRPAGPIQPKGHPQLGGVTYDESPAPVTNAGPVGGEWAL